LVVARDGDFAYASFNVLDFLTCQGTSCLAFPGNQVPISRFNSGLGHALQLLPLPNSSTNDGVNATYTEAGSVPAGGHFTLPSYLSTFGGFYNLLPTQQGPSTATFQLYVDNVLVATNTAQFTIQ